MTTEQPDTQTDTPVAIIGVGCLFPKAVGAKGYWRLISRAQDGIAEVPASHWSPDDFFDEDPRRPDYVYCKRGGFLSPVSFDPSEFGIPPSSLEATDTSQLLGLVAAKMALEDAGYGGEKPFDRSKTSVILGVTGTQELVIPLGARLGHPKWRRALADSGVPADQAETVVRRIADAYVPWQESSFPGLLGNVVAGRISNRLDLSGSNCVVDAACASSMSAVHLALMELSTRRSDMVITGGVDTINDIFMHMCFAKSHILSPTGDARPFSESADGTVLGEGVGLLVLKRLEDARRDGDDVYALIRGLGASSDGRSQSIYAPRAAGQAKALKSAYARAGVDPLTVGLIEAHGTGTRVGDEVEFKALTQVFRDAETESPRSRQFCALGSVKSMIGHTKAASGAAGLIKAALSLHHKVLPPTLKAERPDPKLAMADSPFYLNSRTRPWISRPGHPRRCGVSAFGFGGSNFHAVLEEYRPEKDAVSWDGTVEIAAFSSETAQELIAQLAEFSRALNPESGDPGLELAELAAASRERFSSSDGHRLLLSLDDPADSPQAAAVMLPDLIADLGRGDAHALAAAACKHDWVFYGSGRAAGKTAFVFPGQGSQYLDMGRDLACCFPEALEAFELFDSVYAREGRPGQPPLGDLIYPRPVGGGPNRRDETDILRNTEVSQPAIGAVSMAMTAVLERFGIRPGITCGHSFGELTALWAAGWIDGRSLARLAVARGRLMAAAGEHNGGDAGAMLAVSAPLGDIASLAADISDDLVLANRNSPRQGVLSGPTLAVERAQETCRRRGIRATLLPVSAAFHSPLVASAREPFGNILETISVTPTDTPVFSNTTGLAYPRNPERVREILAEHLLNPVNFVAEIGNLYQAGVRTFVEVGPKTVLTGLIGKTLPQEDVLACPLDSRAGKANGLADLAALLCRIAADGAAVDLSRWESPPAARKKQRMRVPVSGANIRPRSPAADRQPAGTKPFEPETGHRPQAASPMPRAGRPASPPPSEEASDMTTTPTQDIMDKTTTPENLIDADLFTDTLQAVTEGLKAMQAMQLQTAETHRKFLDSQTEASRAIQEMVRQTQRLAGHGTALTAPAVPPASTALPATAVQSPLHPPGPSAPRPAEAADIAHLNGTTADDAAVRETAAPAPTQAAPEVSETAVSQPDPSPGFSGADIEDTLLAAVSELTGYPVETLGLDMDIEADLGIDSIKRVEILSAVEERMPGLPPVAPEDLGDLKTLAQLAQYLSGAASIPAEPAAAVPLSDPIEDHPSKQSDSIQTTLLDVVSELTGYPVETLDLDMDIEADLGIDSIKRVEILSAVEERMPDLPSVSPEDLADLKTLGLIAAYLGSGSDTPAQPESDGVDYPVIPETKASVDQDSVEVLSDPIAAVVDRYSVSVESLPLPETQPLTIPPGRKVFVCDDRSGLSQAIVDCLGDQGINTVLISPDILRHKEFLPSPGGLILVRPSLRDTTERDIKEAFALTRHVASGLAESAELGGAVFASVTSLDGAFGFLGQAATNPVQGGLAGLVKTAALEWPAVACRAIDIAPGWENHQDAARAVVAQVLRSEPDAPTEIGLTPDGSHRLRLSPAPYPTGETIRLDLGPEDVVVVSGGARGVTAEAAHALAKATRPTLVLLGRAPHPLPEPRWLGPLEEKGEIKRAILANEFDNAPPPREIEASFARHMANREITRNLERIRATGATALYFSADVRDDDRIRAIFEEVRAVHGEITGIIHGAGILKDRLILDKSEDQFETVFDTKVKGLFTLLAAAGSAPLKYLLFFSSVTARLGNRGQADYAAANEVLNKVAHREAATRPNCRVVAVNWGPWDGGMVNSGLKKEFERRGVDLIPAHLGPICMLYEMAAGAGSPAEVVVGGKFPREPRTAADLPARHEADAPRLSFSREIDLQRYPILDAHRLNGTPVVPFALIAEWFGHGALHENPGLLFLGLDDMRILKGIRLENDSRVIRLMAARALRKEDTYEVRLELLNGTTNAAAQIHSRATAILAENPLPAPESPLGADMHTAGYFRSMEEVYDKILFHGDTLQGIREVLHLTPDLMVARVASAPTPDLWLAEPLRSRWITDPLALDCAFQMASLWCYEETGNVSLPSYGASYRQYCAEFPGGEITVAMEIMGSGAHKMQANFTFLDSQNRVLARLSGYEAVMDASLNRAFKPRIAANA